MKGNAQRRNGRVSFVTQRCVCARAVVGIGRGGSAGFRSSRFARAERDQPTLPFGLRFRFQAEELLAWDDQIEAKGIVRMNCIEQTKRSHRAIDETTSTTFHFTGENQTGTFASFVNQLARFVIGQNAGFAQNEVSRLPAWRREAHRSLFFSFARSIYRCSS